MNSPSMIKPQLFQQSPVGMQKTVSKAKLFTSKQDCDQLQQIQTKMKKTNEAKHLISMPSMSSIAKINLFSELQDNNDPSSRIPKYKNSKQEDFMQQKSTSLSSSSTNQLSVFSSSINKQLAQETISINMNHKQLQIFTMPHYIDLQLIQILELMHNNINEFPIQSCGMRSLKVLKLDYNNIKSIPIQFCDDQGHSSQLLFFSISHNQLVSLPHNISLLSKNLQVLDAQHNFISCLPQDIGLLTNLKQLLIAFNDFTSIPLSFHMLSQCKLFQLDWFIFVQWEGDDSCETLNSDAIVKLQKYCLHMKINQNATELTFADFLMCFDQNQNGSHFIYDVEKKVSFLHIAAKKQQMGILRFLIFTQPHLINANDSQQLSPLFYAIEHNKARSAKTLLSNGADLNSGVKACYGSYLNLAICMQHFGLVSDLLKLFKVDPLRTDNKGNQSLHFALKYFKKESDSNNNSSSRKIADILCQFVENKNARNHSGLTPLHVAIKSGSYNAVAWALSYNLNQHNSNNNCKFQQTFCVKMLAGGMRQTVIHLAGERNLFQTALLLLSHGAPLFQRDANNLSPIQAACNDDVMVKLIRKKELRYINNFVLRQTKMHIQQQKQYENSFQLCDPNNVSLILEEVDVPENQYDIIRYIDQNKATVSNLASKLQWVTSSSKSNHFKEDEWQLSSALEMEGEGCCQQNLSEFMSVNHEAINYLAQNPRINQVYSSQKKQNGLGQQAYIQCNARKNTIELAAFEAENDHQRTKLMMQSMSLLNKKYLEFVQKFLLLLNDSTRQKLSSQQGQQKSIQNRIDMKNGTFQYNEMFPLQMKLQFMQELFLKQLQLLEFKTKIHSCMKFQNVQNNPSFSEIDTNVNNSFDSINRQLALIQCKQKFDFQNIEVDFIKLHLIQSFQTFSQAQCLQTQSIVQGITNAASYHQLKQKQQYMNGFSHFIVLFETFQLLLINATCKQSQNQIKELILGVQTNSDEKQQMNQNNLKNKNQEQYNFLEFKSQQILLQIFKHQQPKNADSQNSANIGLDLTYASKHQQQNKSSILQRTEPFNIESDEFDISSELFDKEMESKRHVNMLYSKTVNISLQKKQ